MNVDFQEMTIGIDRDFIKITSPNYRITSWPPPRDWPVVVDEHGTIISRWGDSTWDITSWFGRRKILNFGDGEVRKRKQSEPLSAENADLMRMIATWLIWGPLRIRSAATIYAHVYVLRTIVSLCNRNGISAEKLMRFPKVLEQVPNVISASNFDAAITLLHYLYDARGFLGFTIVDANGLKRLVEIAPKHETIQTPYIPPRIWLYQLSRLRECLTDFIANQTQIEACFQFCLNEYAKQYGSLEAALSRTKENSRVSPFNPELNYKKDFPGTFHEVVARFGLSEIFGKWVAGFKDRPHISGLSSYFSIVTFASLLYICNFTLQRREEVGSLRSSCLLWDNDEKFGRVPIICGETTKTDPDSDARWVASPSVEIAIQASSAIAHMRMICDRVNPKIMPSDADRNDPYLSSTATEPWGLGLRHSRNYKIRGVTKDLQETLEKVCSMLFDKEQMKITADDLAIAKRLTTNLPEKEFFVDAIWPLSWHQYRRTGAVNMFASGDISDSTMQQQLKHSSRLMPLYYGRNHSRLRFNNEVQTTVLLAMYEAQVEIVKVAAAEDRFFSPHALERKEQLVINLLSAKETNELVAMAKKGAINFREHRLGGCMKAGLCEYGGLESVARCAGGKDRKPCPDVLFDRAKEPRVRAELRRVVEEMKILPVVHPRYNALADERTAMENYLNAL
ncbi:hypothetical protein LQ564_00210 [Massilia sp. G4R7]|uniref:Integrase n=1 Tax=Massilia phyllostachyos TaxID=2898585 RepID=A0ABS8Q0Y4_9BURK|nr:hypothetical protein [Massilia phyllostachyos]MCD2514732.1 hypothetical protein [Massilia phyllostachyos]